MRWGLDQPQRDDLGLGASGEQNTWLFGLRRMLLGYASGGDGGPVTLAAGIEPYGEVGGLDAAIAGSLAAVVECSDPTGGRRASTPATPSQWAERGRALIEAFVAPTDDRERMTLAALLDALRCWLDACDTAGFDEPVSLAVAREAWLAGIDEPGAEQALSGRRRHLLHLAADARRFRSRWSACWA